MSQPNAERPLTVAESRLIAIVESSDDAIVSKTLEGIVTTWNAGAQRIFGWTSEEIVGKSILTIIPPDRRDEEPEILKRLQAGERVDHFETIRQTKDGRLINVSVTISPVRNEHGQIVGVSKVARDITLQKQFEARLRASKEMAERAREEAEEASRAKDRFLNVLSHELRTPLTPVLAAVGILERDPTLPPRVLEHVRMIRRNVQTEARLVDDLLDLTRIAHGKVDLHHEVVDAHASLRNVLRMVTSESEAKEQVITVSFRAERFNVWADPGRFQQMLLNLLANAVKFTPERGTITVQTSNDGDQTIRIEIIDNGVGIAPELLPRLFQPFEQGERTLSRQFGGLGLGLSIVRSLAELHGAEVTVSSEGVGRGSTFALRMATLDSPTQAPNVGGDETGSNRSYKVLLVEDHRDTREMMRTLLSSFGCTVTATASVKEAVDATERQRFDLLVSDIGLPDGTGLDVMKHVAERFHISGIALSGFGQDADIRRSREAGFAAHLTKPVSIEVLHEAIQRHAQPS